MEAIGDDELGMVLKRLNNKSDRISCSQVCKQWLRVEGLLRTQLRVLDPSLLRSFLPRFPNLVALELGKVLPDVDLEFVAETCPNVQILNLNLRQTCPVSDSTEEIGYDDLTGDGICSVAGRCKGLKKVYLRRRKGIGNVGVISLIKHCTDITHLDLSWCSRITDGALESLGAASSLQSLNLHGCSLITDWGLASLATGSSARTLQKLDLSECDRISDIGVVFLQQLCCLEELSLAECGPKITDAGGVSISAICGLKSIDFSWLINISDATFLSLANNCNHLVWLNITGCELATSAGLRCFATHKSLEVLIAASCYSLSADGIEHTLLGCSKLRYAVLDKRLRGWISGDAIANVNPLCRIEWR
ncbi:F-box protein At3g58530-like [Nymphaea colorata]|uniref:Uncharacterized protein n=1 Tax=Nymphaea colorata TaxID=210225 RepID=A0A5K1E2W1_9MAGN|nr:F-box protein At3g58530-like [Nymphaea colorata]